MITRRSFETSGTLSVVEKDEFYSVRVRVRAGLCWYTYLGLVYSAAII